MVSFSVESCHFQTTCNGLESKRNCNKVFSQRNNVLVVKRDEIELSASVDEKLCARKDCNIKRLCGSFYQIQLDNWSVQATDVISLEPQGLKLSTSALLSIPIYVDVESGYHVDIYTSDTNAQNAPQWQKLHVDVKIIKSFVQFRLKRFALFVAVVHKPKPKNHKKIFRENQGTILLQMENVRVLFPRFALNTPEITASVECLYADTFYVSRNFLKAHSFELAAPVVSLEPHGCQFNCGVNVTVPLPKGKSVLKQFGDIVLKFMYSQTAVNEKPRWQPLDTNYTINKKRTAVTFTVHHFTLFSVFWSILDFTLPENLKLQATWNIPRFSFLVYFRALMTERTNTKQFGLCIVCHRFGNASDECENQYPLEVGVCKPRKIRTGKLDVILNSRMFGTDLMAGESSLRKSVEFCGHDFDVHFTCLFNDRHVANVGLFGKVRVCVQSDDGFSFNLVRTGKRHDGLINVSAKCSTVETSGSCNRLAKLLGYSSCEIEEKFSHHHNPTEQVLRDFLLSGGHHLDYLKALHQIAFGRQASIECGDDIATDQAADDPINVSSSSRKRTFEETLSSREMFTDLELEALSGELMVCWKNIGRKLGISELEIREIELNNQLAGEKERAYQMLLVWREKEPENCVPRRLHQVLHNNGFKYTACQCLKIIKS